MNGPNPKPENRPDLDIDLPESFFGDDENVLSKLGDDTDALVTELEEGVKKRRGVEMQARKRVVGQKGTSG